MDLGVGSFVFSSGLVSARPIVSGKPLPPLAKRLQSALRSTLALLVLGGVRLALVKGVDYAVRKPTSNPSLHTNTPRNT